MFQICTDSFVTPLLPDFLHLFIPILLPSHFPLYPPSYLVRTIIKFWGRKQEKKINTICNAKIEMLRFGSPCLLCGILHPCQLCTVSVRQCFRLSLHSLCTGQDKKNKIPDTYFVTGDEIQMKLKLWCDLTFCLFFEEWKRQDSLWKGSLNTEELSNPHFPSIQYLDFHTVKFWLLEIHHDCC